ncbi:MAG: Planctomycete cytochrome, partial [Verrucomicrobiaceae bacterium]|nr:Planctomycete cytochrome [Verrucomicrobiaceae bacterium]
MLRFAFTSLLIATALPGAEPIDFVKEIQPIFVEHCYQCHGPERQEADFRLDNKESALKGGDLGIAIVLGKSAESLLIQAVKGLKPKLKMPRKGEPLSVSEIAKLVAWIDAG